MATITKAYTENAGTGTKASWALSLTGTNASNELNSGSIKVYKPTLSAKYTASNKGKGLVTAVIKLKCRGTYITSHTSGSWSNSVNYTFPYPTTGTYATMASGTTYNVPLNGSYEANDYCWIQVGDFFDSSNPDTASLPVTAYTYYLDLASNNSAETNGAHYVDAYNEVEIGTVCYIQLNAPPQVTLGTPTYTSPYANIGTYSVPLTTLKALRGGNIVSVKLTIGADSTTQTYSASTVSDQTISVIPSVAGTYTPTLTVTDSRGQTTTTTFTAITVNAYAVPSLNFDVFRSNSSGIKDDEGVYGLITATINFTDAIATLTQPAVTIDGTITNNVAWYSAYNSSTGIASAISDWSAVSSGDTIYGLINGSFSGSQSYVVGMTVTDSEGGSSQTITQTLSTAFYTIDFQAGGKEIAFGAPANDNLSQHPNGLFKCAMDVQFEGDVSGVTGSGTSVPTADEVAEFDSTAHMNSTDMTTGSGGEVENFVNSLDVSGVSLKGLIKYKRHDLESSTTLAAHASTSKQVPFTAPDGYVLLGVVSAQTNGAVASIYPLIENMGGTSGTITVWVRNASTASITVNSFAIACLYIRSDLYEA